jgi:hypothetical protein
MSASGPTAQALPGIRDAILATLRQNRWACLGLNFAVIGLVISYYRWPAMGKLWEAVGHVKTEWSYGFSALSTMMAAVVLPALVQRAMGAESGPGQARRLGWSAFYWAYRGMEIDWFYRIQGKLFGTGTDWRTVGIKLAVDQFVYSAFWAVPSYLVFVRWVEHRSLKQAVATMDGRFWTHTYWSVLFTNWLVWLPAVSLVYSLPPALQFPLFSMILTFYILLITVLVKA